MESHPCDQLVIGFGSTVTLAQAAQTFWPYEYNGKEGYHHAARVILTGCGWAEDPETGLWHPVPVLLWYDNGTGHFDCAGRYPSLWAAKKASRESWRVHQLITPVGVDYVVPGDKAVIWDNDNEED